MPNFLKNRTGLSATFFTALLLTGCFEDIPEVTTSGDETSDGTTSSSESSGQTESTGTTTDTSADTGTSGETDTGMPMDMGSPCDDTATPQWVADQLMEDCASIFGDSACMQDEGLTRAQLIGNLMMNFVPEDLLLCYEDPVEAHFPDVPVNHPAYVYVEQAFFLGVIALDPFFEPDMPADVCWAEEVLMALEDLPAMIAVASSGQSDGNFGVGVGPVLVTRYMVCGTNMADHLDVPLTVVNNLDADFTMGEDTPALQDLRLRCETPDGSGFIPTAYMTLSGGEATFDMLDCYRDSGVPMVLQVQARTAAPGQFRLGLNPETFAILGDGYIPLYDVQ